MRQKGKEIERVKERQTGRGNESETVGKEREKEIETDMEETKERQTGQDNREGKRE